MFPFPLAIVWEGSVFTKDGLANRGATRKSISAWPGDAGGYFRPTEPLKSRISPNSKTFLAERCRKEKPGCRGQHLELEGPCVMRSDECEASHHRAPLFPRNFIGTIFNSGHSLCYGCLIWVIPRQRKLIGALGVVAMAFKERRHLA